MNREMPPAERLTRKSKSPRRSDQPHILKWSAWTDKGKVRANNEDSFLGLRFDSREVHRLGKFGEAPVREMDFTFAVSDGMGGARAGEFASLIAVEKITTLLPRRFKPAESGERKGFDEDLVELFRQIHRALAHLGRSYDECYGMETTMSLCWFTPGRMHFGHIGDSRIYHLPKGSKTTRQLTEDDTHVGWLQRTGQINEREARTHPRRNVLQKALGGENQFITPQVGVVEYERDDIFLICSDGLAEGFYNHQLADLLCESRTAKNFAVTARRLVETSVMNDGRDNVTALVVQAG